MTNSFQLIFLICPNSFLYHFKQYMKIFLAYGLLFTQRSTRICLTAHINERKVGCFYIYKQPTCLYIYKQRSLYIQILLYIYTAKLYIQNFAVCITAKLYHLTKIWRGRLSDKIRVCVILFKISETVTKPGVVRRVPVSARRRLEIRGGVSKYRCLLKQATTSIVASQNYKVTAVIIQQFQNGDWLYVELPAL
eukprot:TRINITY_DN7189_c0_g1_i5.p1 TRINITY_DN7189_c0_g1~~TRINITY_DN7189_c0_g1_i5.p1  ORF type:complete len:193 (-),score=-10.10 TRINITY_DN7189_c0_g1_i5:308-886(-)